ncbi:protein kinase domain-containing protein [Dictyobacter vulcani]|nr:serine/threonine-protein kinase [Dictyobacter vulcani]
MVKDELLGKQLASYILAESLGHGAFGSVYLGKHFLLTQKPPVAIKVLNTVLNSQEEFDRFFQEAVILDNLAHPNILPVIDANLYEGYPFFVAEYAPGGSLRDRLDQLDGAPMQVEEAVTILTQVGAGLQHAHDMDVVHRDLKPANILFNAKDDAVLADFGIALEIQKTRRVDEIGTPAYMSPEQFKGKLSKKSDQYALGCIAYEILTGQQLFISDDPYIIGYKHIFEAPIDPRDLNADLSPAMAAALLKALSKERDDRFESVAEFIQVLQSALSSPRTGQKRTATRQAKKTNQAKKISHTTQAEAQQSIIDTNPPTRERKPAGPDNPVTLPKFLQKHKQNPNATRQPTRQMDQLTPIWNTTSGLQDVYYSEATVANGIIYAGTFTTNNDLTGVARHLRALDISTGEHLWSYKANGGIYAAPVVSDGLLYVCSGTRQGGGKIAALDADTGEAFWVNETDEPLRATPTIFNDIIYVHSEHAVYALNVATGQQYWDVTLKAPLQGRPMIVNNVVYISTERGHCYAVDAERGQKIATYADVGQVYATVPFDEHVVCICVYNDQLYALDMHSGATYWSLPLENQITNEVEIEDGIAYISTEGTFATSTARTQLLAINLATGQKLWAAYLRNEISATPLVVDGIVYLTTSSQEVYMLDTQHGKLIHSMKMHGGRVSRPYVSNGWLLINTNEIYAFQLS